MRVRAVGGARAHRAAEDILRLAAVDATGLENIVECDDLLLHLLHGKWHGCFFGRAVAAVEAEYTHDWVLYKTLSRAYHAAQAG